ncbi:CBU_0592 family membrane protein [Flavobacterium sp.]|uniref:CBU_0592 family membrane protein n=1 Tax=Flavobacterium sp. TaxID=239 RepID=UPI003D0A77FD
MKFNDIIGTIGVTIVLMAYFLGILKRIKSNGAVYYFLNFLGAGLACYASILIHYIPFVILEGIWSLLSLTALIKTLKS